MNVIIDTVTVRVFRQLADRTFNGQRRCYYASDDYPAVLIVSHGAPLSEMLKQVRVVLIDHETTDSNIVLDRFPNAPARWRDMQIVSVSVTPHRPDDERPRTLGEALYKLKVYRE